MIGGVCGGAGKYFGIDPTLLRIGFVALVLIGGAGLIVYAAAVLLVPRDEDATAATSTSRDRTLALGMLVAFAAVAATVGSVGFVSAGPLVPIAFVALGGLAIWWLVSGERPRGGPATLARRAAQGIALLLGCLALAVASFLASGLGGAVAIAAIVIVAGAALVAAAFVGGARWLILPALAIALPLAFVSAAGIDLHGGFGDPQVHPTTLADLSHGYRLGAGQLVVDLRDLDLPPGDHPLTVHIGAGHALVLVPDDVCVASTASVGIGGVEVFDRSGGGINTDWSDDRKAPAGTPRLVLRGDVGLGLLEVRHSDDDRTGHDDGPPWMHDRDVDPSERNAACSGATT
jgi:phage shock protein PspC (stress-responsive transcriptional regulator)